MRILLLSTRFSTFAAPILASLTETQHEVSGVLLLTRRRRRQNSLSLLWSVLRDFGLGGFLRILFETSFLISHQALRRSAFGRRIAKRCLTVAEVALARHVPMCTTRDIGGNQAYDLLRGFNPDLIVVASFSQILPPKVLECPRVGAINIHPGLLPQNKGPTPIFWALFNGVDKTGVAIHSMVDRVDSGDLLATKTVNLAPQDNEKTLSDKLGLLAAEMLPEVIELVESGRAGGTPQDGQDACYYRRPTPGQRRALTAILRARNRCATLYP